MELSVNKKYYMVKEIYERGEYYCAWLTKKEVKRIKIDKRYSVTEWTSNK